MIQVLIVILVALIVFIFNKAIMPDKNVAKGLKLMKKFDTVMSMMPGMTQEDLITFGGPPNAVCKLGKGQILQWYETGFYISIYFDSNGKFSSITDRTITRHYGSLN